MRRTWRCSGGFGLPAGRRPGRNVTAAVACHAGKLCLPVWQAQGCVLHAVLLMLMLMLLLYKPIVAAVQTLAQQQRRRAAHRRLLARGCGGCGLLPP